MEHNGYSCGKSIIQKSLCSLVKARHSWSLVNVRCRGWLFFFKGLLLFHSFQGRLDMAFISVLSQRKSNECTTPIILLPTHEAAYNWNGETWTAIGCCSLGKITWPLGRGGGLGRIHLFPPHTHTATPFASQFLLVMPNHPSNFY